MSQRAWETAMGMRGYRGSPAEAEDRRETMKEWDVYIGGAWKGTVMEVSEPSARNAAASKFNPPCGADISVSAR